MNEWQPIETAPKDGTPILAYVEDVAIQMEYSYFLKEWGPVWLAAHGCGCCGEYSVPEPTHWMPLPDPPTPNPE